MWKSILEPDSPHVTIWRMHIACWIPKSTSIHSEYVILIDFLLQPWLHERASMLRYTYIPCLVKYTPIFTGALTGSSLNIFLLSSFACYQSSKTLCPLMWSSKLSGAWRGL